MILHPVVMDVKLLLEQLGPIVFFFYVLAEKIPKRWQKKDSFHASRRNAKVCFLFKNLSSLSYQRKGFANWDDFAFVLEFIRTVQKSDICLASNNNFETALYNNTFLYNASRYLHEIILIPFQLCLCVVMIHKRIK